MIRSGVGSVGISAGQGTGGYGDAVGVIVGVGNRVSVIHRGHSAAGGQGRGIGSNRAAVQGEGKGGAGVGRDILGESHPDDDVLAGVVFVVAAGVGGDGNAADGEGAVGGGRRRRPAQRPAGQDGDGQQEECQGREAQCRFATPVAGGGGGG